MKNLFFTLTILIASSLQLWAQEIYLPVSSQNESAKAAYIKGLKASENANIPAFQDALEEAVAADANFFMGYANLAFMATAFRDYETAATFIEKGLAIDPAGLNQAELILRKSLEAWAEDSEADPTQTMEALVAAYPTTRQAHEWAATSSAWISGDTEAALRHSLKVVELSPEYGGGYNNLGYSYMADGQMDKAKTAFETYLRLSPNEANAYDSMAEYYLNQGDYAKSAELYDKAASMGLTSAKQRADEARAKLE